MTQLTSILTNLSQGAIESVQNGQALGNLDKYLHIKRNIEDKLCAKMDSLKNQSGGLILLVGSAGDGKSHLISTIRNRDEYSDFYFYNDATESYSPIKTAVDTLKDVLADFSDEKIEACTKKLVLAINIGTLNAFIENDYVKTSFSKLVSFVSPLFSEEEDSIKETERLLMVQFSNQQIFEFDKNSEEDYPVDSFFLREFLHKITNQDQNNPFFVAYKNSIPLDNSITDPVVINYQLLCIPEIQETIIKLIIEAFIRFKLMVTPRDFQDFIYSILVYEDLEHYSDSKNLLEALLPSMLFNSERSKIQKYLSLLDPLKYSSTEHDKDLANLFTSSMIPEGFLDEAMLNIAVPALLTKVRMVYGNNRKNIVRTTQFLFRLKHLLSYHSESKEYLSFLKLLKGFMTRDGQEIQYIYQMVSTVIPRHYGSYYSPDKTVPLNIQGSRYKLFANINIVPDEFSYTYVSPNEFSLSIILKWKVLEKKVALPVDYQLYEYLVHLNNGRLSLNFESDKNMAFSHFIRKLISLSDSTKEVIIMTADNKKYILSNQFGIISYRPC